MYQNTEWMFSVQQNRLASWRHFSELFKVPAKTGVGLGLPEYDIQLYNQSLAKGSYGDGPFMQ
ncbi:MAG: hypothetical protein GY861_02525 [bacterium]|nr:hypothetical protein [bacterium]